MSDQIERWGVAIDRPPSPGVLSVEIVDTSTGKAMHCIVANEGPAKRLRGIAMVDNDLERVKGLLNAMREGESDALTELMWHGAIIAYARAFASTDGRGFKLERDLHVAGLGAARKEVHERVMHLRNEYVAHAGQNNVQSVVVVLPLRGDPAAPSIERAMVIDVASIKPRAVELAGFVDLVEALQASVGELRKATEQAVLSHYRKKSPQEIRRLAGEVAAVARFGSGPAVLSASGAQVEAAPAAPGASS